MVHDPAWEDDDVVWGGTQLTSKELNPVFVEGVNFWGLGLDATAPLTVFLERMAVVHADGLVLLGGLVWPLVQGPSGGIIGISLGASETPEGAIDWEGPYDFIIGTDTFLDFMVTGKYLAIRFESTGVAAWSLQSYSIDYEVIGLH